MTKRNPVSAKQNIWYDAQQVDNDDLTLEQNFNDVIQSGIINNHIGTGVLPEALVDNVIFDSLLTSNFLDGLAVYAQNQPSDNNFGNQIEIELTNSLAAGKKTVKLALIGLDFQSNLQYETFVFKTNEIQISKKHFTKVLLILFNDFIGNPDLSLNLGGRLILREAKPFSLSRDAVMVSQDSQPNLFFRDFFIDGPLSLNAFLQSALPYYNIDNLNIYTTELDNKILPVNDVTTQIGQKFLATTNNIQKVQFLLSVRNTDLGKETELDWNGDLVISIYPLQSDIDCPTDIAPNLEIDFPPFNIPVAQISFNYSTLLANGIKLDSVPQPVDFIFSNTPAAVGNLIIPGKYYAVTIKRSGSADKCDILISNGKNLIENSRITTFTGTLWADIPEEDLWFIIWSDAAKVSDGQAYDNGHGITLPKTVQDSVSLATVDYCLDNLQFTGNEVYRAALFATTLETVPVPDQRTGNPVLTRKEFSPNIQLLNNINLTNLEKTIDPLLLGSIADKNIKFYDAFSSLITSKLYGSSMVGDEIFIRIVNDVTDTGRYDLSVNNLITNLLNGEFVNAKLIPNYLNPSVYYRISSATLETYMVGDVNGDGQITQEDVDLLKTYIGYNFNTGLPINTVYSTTGTTSTFTNGYNTLTKPFINEFGLAFEIVNPTTNIIVASGTDGVLVANPNNPREAQFTSSTTPFSTIVGISQFKIIVKSLTPENYGGFDIKLNNAPGEILTIRKILLNNKSIPEMLRCDVDQDFAVTFDDGYLLQSYVDKFTTSTSSTTTYPKPATDSFKKIGTTFDVIRFKVEKFIDRTDDYVDYINDFTSTPALRSKAIHESPEIFLSDGYFELHDFYTNPITFNIEKQLTWDESLIVTNSRPKLVPSAYTTLNGFLENKCNLEGIGIEIYGSKPDFDKGRVDLFIPDNLIIGNGGELHRPNGDFYKVDFEVGTIVLEIPDGYFGSEKTINLMDNFIASTINPTNSNPTGLTSLGFPAMKFADCSYVLQDALLKDQLRFSVSVQSFSPNVNGLSIDGYYGSIVDGKIGVSVDYTTGLLTLNFTNLYEDDILLTLSTKIQVHVYLKKGGFNNKPVFVDSVKVQNMLKLISVFSGANVGGPSALVDLSADVTGVLPIIHGGTGLNSVGAFGTVLTSTGGGLSYQFLTDLPGFIPFSSGTASANKAPKTDGYGFLDPSFYYKNPIYIDAFNGNVSNNLSVPAPIGGFTFRFDSFILQGLKSINLEAILETTSGDAAEILLYDVTSTSYITLTSMSTTSISPVVVRSQNLISPLVLKEGASDFVYEVHLLLNTSSPGADVATCKMARLVLTYDNPAGTGPSTGRSWNFVPYLPSPNPI